MTESRREIAEYLYRAAGKFFAVENRHYTNITFKEVHLSPGLRADVLNISAKDEVVILELKSCKEDFNSDSKWEKYLDYCDYFYFMCPTGVILLKDVPEKVGLIYINEKEGKLYYNIMRKPRKLKPSRLNSSWFKTIYKRLAFRRFAEYNGKTIELKDDLF